MRIVDTTLITRRAGILEAEVGGEMVLMRVSGTSYYGLDRIGSVIWRCIAEPVSFATLCDVLLERYDGARETVRRDLLDLLQRLRTEGLIDVS